MESAWEVFSMGGFFGSFGGGGSFNSNMNFNSGPCGCCGPCCCCCDDDEGNGPPGPSGSEAGLGHVSVPEIMYAPDDDTPEGLAACSEKAFILVKHPEHCMTYSGLLPSERPEGARLVEHNMADCDRGARRYYSGLHGGTAVIHFRHDNWFAKTKPECANHNSIYYGIYFWNPNAADAHITLLRRGTSYGWTYSNETFKQYLSAKKPKVITLTPNSGKWLFVGREFPEPPPPEKGPACFTTDRKLALPIGKYSSFDGALKFTTSRPVHVQVEAWVDFNQIKGTQLEPQPTQPYTYDTTGVSPCTVGELRGEFRWEFNDAEPMPDPGGRCYLEVDVSAGRLEKIRGRAWTTHTTGHSWDINPVRDDILPYRVVACAEPLEHSERNADNWRGHLANWGVVYRETLTLVNNGKNIRRVDYQFRVKCNHYITVWSSTGGLWSYHYSEHMRDHPYEESPNGIPNSRNFAAAEDNTITVASAVVPPKEKRTLQVTYVLGGHAVGGIEHRLKLTKIDPPKPKEKK